MAQNSILNNDAMTSVVTPMGLIIDTFLDLIENWDDKLAYVYDENLSYETAQAKWRQDNSVDATNPAPLPMFAFRRSVLRWEDEKSIGQRSRQIFANVQQPDGSVKKYQGIIGAFDIDFLYITKNMLDLERFEITYLMQNGIAKNSKNFKVDFPEIGETDYSIEYGPLDEKTINTDNSYYKIASGTFTIRGVFYKFDSDVKIIKEIRAAIKDYIAGTCPPQATETLGKITVKENVTILE